MGVLEAVGLDSMFGDVQRMDKRQVSLDLLVICYAQSILITMLLVVLSTSQFWNDCFVGADDLERFNGCDW